MLLYWKCNICILLNKSYLSIHLSISLQLPMQLALDSPNTPRPWLPQLGSSDPEKHTSKPGPLACEP